MWGWKRRAAWRRRGVSFRLGDATRANCFPRQVSPARTAFRADQSRSDTCRMHFSTLSRQKTRHPRPSRRGRARSLEPSLSAKFVYSRWTSSRARGIVPRAVRDADRAFRDCVMRARNLGNRARSAIVLFLRARRAQEPIQRRSRCASWSARPQTTQTTASSRLFVSWAPRAALPRRGRR